MTKVVLALGGGGFKGIAHLGVITQLEELGYEICGIAGTSAGGLVGGLYAADVSIQSIVDAVRELDGRSLFRRTHSDSPSLLGTSGLRSVLSGLLANSTFSDTRVPFACTAVDLSRNFEVHLDSGSLLDALTATMAIPGILPPFVQGDSILVDGGVLDPVPVLLARRIAPSCPVVAVSLYPPIDNWESAPMGPVISSNALPFPVPEKLWQALTSNRIAQSMRIFAQSMELCLMMMGELRLTLEKPEVVLRPWVYDTGILDFNNIDNLLGAGRQAVLDAHKNLEEAFSLRGRAGHFLQRHRPAYSPQVVGKSEAPASKKSKKKN